MPQCFVLQVKVHNATGVKRGFSIVKAKPSAEVTLTYSGTSTSVRVRQPKRTSTPIFDETCSFNLGTQLHPNGVLTLTIVDGEEAANLKNSLGEVQIPLDGIFDDVDSFQRKEFSLTKKSKASGKVRLSFALPRKEMTTEAARVFGSIGENSSSPRSTVTAAAAAASSATAGAPPLPPLWAEHRDSNGRTFYVNHRDRVTQWERPSPEAPPAAVMARNTTTTTTTTTTAAAAAASSSSTGVSRSVLTEPLPAGWERRTTPTGRVFYVNHNLRATQWDPPTSTTPPSGASAATSTSRTSAATSTRARSGSEAPAAGGSEDDLPQGWERRFTAEGEEFFVDHSTRKTQWTHPKKQSSSQTWERIMGDDPDPRPLPNGWERRMDAKNRVFFVNHNEEVTQWTDPRPELQGTSKHAPNCPEYTRDFQKKVAWFRSRLRQPVKSKCPLRIDGSSRVALLETSFKEVMSLQPSDLRARLEIHMDGQDGLDYGGISRQWFLDISRELFSPKYALFKFTTEGNYTLMVNPQSHINENHLKYFQFAGRILGLAMFHNRLLDVHFARAFYSCLLGKALGLPDLEDADPEVFRSIKWILDNPVDEMGFTFTYDDSNFGEVQTRELVPGGEEKEVNDQNKREYVKLRIQATLKKNVEKQLGAILHGLTDIIHSKLIKCFDWKELELFLAGVTDIDVADWKNNTQYRVPFHPGHKVIRWFWNVVNGMDREQRSRLLQFVTGTAKLPPQGFQALMGSSGAQPFCIDKSNGSSKSLPKAHTCFNRIDLPMYTSQEVLRQKLLFAMEETEGFGLE